MTDYKSPFAYDPKRNCLSGIGNSLNQAGLGNGQQVQGTITAGEVGDFGTRVTINVPAGFIITAGTRVTLITHS